MPQRGEFLLLCFLRGTEILCALSTMTSRLSSATSPPRIISTQIYPLLHSWGQQRQWQPVAYFYFLFHSVAYFYFLFLLHFSLWYTSATSATSSTSATFDSATFYIISSASCYMLHATCYMLHILMRRTLMGLPAAFLHLAEEGCRTVTRISRNLQAYLRPSDRLSKDTVCYSYELSGKILEIKDSRFWKDSERFYKDYPESTNNRRTI